MPQDEDIQASLNAVFMGGQPVGGTGTAGGQGVASAPAFSLDIDSDDDVLERGLFGASGKGGVPYPAASPALSARFTDIAQEAAQSAYAYIPPSAPAFLPPDFDALHLPVPYPNGQWSSGGAGGYADYGNGQYAYAHGGRFGAESAGRGYAEEEYIPGGSSGFSGMGAAAAPYGPNYDDQRRYNDRKWREQEQRWNDTFVDPEPQEASFAGEDFIDVPGKAYDVSFKGRAQEFWDKKSAGFREAMKSKDMAYAIGYGFATTATAETNAFDPLVSGNSYLPDQVNEQASTGLFPLIGAIGGTLVGSKFGPNGALAGQFVGQSAMTTAEDLVDKWSSGHIFAQERAGQAIGEGQGGSAAINEFVEALRSALTPATRELAETMQRLSQGGPVGTAAPGEFGQFQYQMGTAFTENTTGMNRLLGSNPYLASVKDTFLTHPYTGLSTDDYMGLGAAAAMTGDYGGMKSAFAYAEAESERGTLNPAYKQDSDFAKRREGESVWEKGVEDLFEPTRVRAYNAARQRLGEMPRAVGVNGIGQTIYAKSPTEEQYLPGAGSAHKALVSEEDQLHKDMVLHTLGEADIAYSGSLLGADSARLGGSESLGGGAAAIYAALPGMRRDADQGLTALDVDIVLNNADADRFPKLRSVFLANSAADQQKEAQIRAGLDATAKSAFDTGLGEKEATFGLGMTRGTLSGASAASQVGGYNNQADHLTGIARGTGPLSPTERAGIEDNALRMRYTAANAVYDEENRDIARGRSIRDADTVQREFLGSPGDVYDASIRALDSDRDQLRQNASERTRGNLTFAQRQGLDQQDVGLQSDLAIGPERARRSYYGAEGELLGAAQSGDRAGLSRDIGLYGNSAFGLHNVFQDDQQKVDNDYRDLSTSPNGSVAQKQAYARWRGDLQEQTENRDSSMLYRQTQSERVHDFQDEGAFRRSLIAPYMDGPDSNPLTRGNAVLGDLRRDLSGAQAALKATPQTSPAYEQNAHRVEDFQNRIAELEHSRYSEMFSALPESIAGAPGSGIMAGIVPTAAMTSRFTSNPIFGGFGAPAPMPVSSVGGIQPGGTAGAFQTGSGMESLLRELISVVRGNSGHMAPSAPWAGAGATMQLQERTYNPARPPF